MIPTSPDPVLLDGAAALSKVQSLGLEMSWLVRAVIKSEMIRRSTSSYEPSNSPGFKAWASGFGELAELSAPRGWRKEETSGLPRIVHAKSDVGIAVVTGDEQTGRYGAAPKSKSPRGPVSKKFVNSNQMLLPWGTPGLVRLPKVGAQSTWWLLIHSDGQTVKAELSFPMGLSEDSKLYFWQTRILLDIPADGVYREDIGDDAGEEPLQFEVPVRRR